ncbi:MAG: hypothetical protein V1688_03485 [bacterium]
MNIESVKNINITLLFSSPLNHLLISQNDLLNKFKSEDADDNQHSFIDAPGLKVLVFPKKQKEIVFEPTRILLNDKTGIAVENTEVIDDLQKILSLEAVEQNKLNAYGFNYDAVVVPKENFDFKDFISEKIINIGNLKSAGISISFEKNGVLHTVDLKPINNNKLVAHFNAHINTDKLPDASKLKTEIHKQYEEFENIINKI